MAQISNLEDAPPITKQTHSPVCTRTYHKPAKTRQRHTSSNGAPQGSVRAPMFFNVDTSDIPHTASTQYIYTDDIIPHTASTQYIYADDIIPHTASTQYIYADDIIPHTASTQYIYADDIAHTESGLNYADIQQTLTNDLTCLDLFLQRRRLRLNVNKTVASCFHLTNCLANQPPDGSSLRRENDRTQ